MSHDLEFHVAPLTSVNTYTPVQFLHKSHFSSMKMTVPLPRIFDGFPLFSIIVAFTLRKDSNALSSIGMECCGTLGRLCLWR